MSDVDDEPLFKYLARAALLYAGGNVSDIPSNKSKYSTDSSVYADQSIINPNNDEVLYCIACILQSEIFEQVNEAANSDAEHPDLVLHTDLPVHLGGPQPTVPLELVERECVGDPELREKLLAETVPLVDTILRFISWIFQSTKYSAQCNIIAFIYIKRIIASRKLLSFNNWRAVWLGAVVIAQKFVDDSCVRTSSFCSILPGVSKVQIKAIEIKIFALLDFSGRVKPSVYARYYYEIRKIFHGITGLLVTRHKQAGPTLRPLRRTQGYVLQTEPPAPSSKKKSSKAADHRPKSSAATHQKTSGRGLGASGDSAKPPGATLPNVASGGIEGGPETSPRDGDKVREKKSSGTLGTSQTAMEKLPPLDPRVGRRTSNVSKPQKNRSWNDDTAGVITSRAIWVINYP